jgi:hypothetical protein
VLRQLGSSLALSLGLGLVAGCHTMHVVQPAQLGAARAWERLWVTRPDHSTVVVHAPEVRGDTLIGFVDGTYREMPLSQVVSIRAREGARVRTVALVMSGAAATGALLLYFGNRNYVGGNAQTCTSGNSTGDGWDNLPIPCCKVQPGTPC